MEKDQTQYAKTKEVKDEQGVDEILNRETTQEVDRRMHQDDEQGKITGDVEQHSDGAVYSMEDAESANYTEDLDRQLMDFAIEEDAVKDSKIEILYSDNKDRMKTK